MPQLLKLAESVKGDMGMLWMLISGILVFFMQAGFFLVESGMTDSKNAVNIAMKNFLDIAVGSLAFWFVGYSLMYGADASGGWFFTGEVLSSLKELPIYSSKPYLLQPLQLLYLELLQEEQNIQRMLFLVL